MFHALIKRLFPSADDSNQPNFYYFEDTRPVEQEEAPEATSNAIHLMSAEEAHQKAFYDVLFGQSEHSEQHDELSLFITKKVQKLLEMPKLILKVVPLLPASLTKIISQLNDGHAFDTNALIALIRQEPVIAAKVIELANSSFYNRSDKDVTDLKSAFMLLGQNGLMQGVINGFINKLTPQPTIYFQQYGHKIWQHSLATGQIAKEIISQSPYKQGAAEGYLIGLICNLGNMIIFQLLMEAFSYTHPDCQPNTFAFKNLLYENSKKLTTHIARYWHMPKSILETLVWQEKISQAAMLQSLLAEKPIACYIYEANIISELIIRFEHGDIEQTAMEQAKESLLFSDEAKQYLDKFLQAETVSCD
ncbi:HDOD domain-containing protein [Thalassomonas actiniarum]|uniref:HDOD domain-containing protein n=1 Tax=Thalassomonas actiniarum TaxID=485447 RepID=A0AAE9YKN1_9GAMM|nr:HDOD domain-containing protein [Thalassomonas actiniarum]WDD97399.1 HDOD domain-containing protein [Thalassomonas actiniarum]